MLENTRAILILYYADDSLTLLSDRQIDQSDQKQTLNFLYHTAEALDFLHKQEILHGTLNPENIALDANGYPLLFDYGLNGVFKKLLLENMDDGFDNLSISSLTCTSPEQILGRNPTRASDIYTFGIIGYYYIFGKYPFDGQYVPERAISHFNDGIIRRIQVFDIHSNNTLQFIQKCIQLDPEARFASFSQILNILEQMKSGKQHVSRSRKGSQSRSLRIRMRFSSSFVSIAVLVISLFVFYYLYALKPQLPYSHPISHQPWPHLHLNNHATQTQNIVVETSTASRGERTKLPHASPSEVEPSRTSQLLKAKYRLSPVSQFQLPTSQTCGNLQARLWQTRRGSCCVRQQSYGDCHFCGCFYF